MFMYQRILHFRAIYVRIYTLKDVYLKFRHDKKFALAPLSTVPHYNRLGLLAKKLALYI